MFAYVYIYVYMHIQVHIYIGMKHPPKWRKCASLRGNCLRGWRRERAMDRMDRPRTSIDERMLSGRRAVMIV